MITSTKQKKSNNPQTQKRIMRKKTTPRKKIPRRKNAHAGKNRPEKILSNLKKQKTHPPKKKSPAIKFENQI